MHVPILKDLICTNKVDAIFLVETLVHSNKVEELRNRRGFDCCFAVDRQGRGDSLALL